MNGEIVSCRWIRLTRIHLLQVAVTGDMRLVESTYKELSCACSFLLQRAPMQKYFDPPILSWQGFDLTVALKNFWAPALLIILATVFVQAIHRYVSNVTKYRGLALPPGPPRKWIIGNLLQMPKGDFLTQTLKWKDEYGKPSKIKMNRRVFAEHWTKRSNLLSSTPKQKIRLLEHC